MTDPSQPDITSEMLMAYADGVLDADTTARIEAALPDRPDWQAELAGYALTRDRLAHAFDDALSEPVPDALTRLVLGGASDSAGDVGTAPPAPPSTGQVLRFPTERRRLPMGRLAAAAAVFAAGTLAGGGGAAFLQVASREAPNATIMLASTLAPADPLARVLESAPSAVTVSLGDDRRVRPVQSFARADGTLCREFEAGREGAGGVVGLACREPEGWRVDMLLATPHAPALDGGFATASGAHSEAIDARLDAMGAGDGFDAATETCLIAQGFSDPANCLEKGPE
jgi:anti-sigma factor RsiW